MLKKKSENPEEQIQLMVNKRIKLVKQEIILEDDQAILKKMVLLLKEMRLYDDEYKEILSMKEQKEGYKKLNSQMSTRNGSPVTGERNGRLNPLDRNKSPNGPRGNQNVQAFNCDINSAPLDNVMTSLKSIIKPSAKNF